MRKVLKVTLKNVGVSKTVQFIFEGKVIAQIGVFRSGSIFIDDAERVCLDTNMFSVKQEHRERFLQTIARKIK